MEERMREARDDLRKRAAAYRKTPFDSAESAIAWERFNDAMEHLVTVAQDDAIRKIGKILGR